MAGDPFGLLLRQRIVFFGGEARMLRSCCWEAGGLLTCAASLCDTYNDCC
jgi:hypothetical protein